MNGERKLQLAPFQQKIKTKKAKIGVIGLGYVGLPLAMAFAKAGFLVTGIDVDKKKIASLCKGRSYILDVSSQEIQEVSRRRRFKATESFSVISSLDAVIICVPTPLGKTKEPDISFIVQATQKVAAYLRAGQLVVLESTTYPGTTEEVMLPLLEKSGLRVEKDFFLAFSPERVDPGNKNFNTVSIPKVVGGVGPGSQAAVKSLYGAVIRRTVEVSSAKTAEMVKLLENTFRSVNIGFINEMAILCRRLGVDIWEVIEAAKTKPFGYMPFYPGPGIGGHCLPVDPLYLSWKSRLHGFEAKMIDLASSVNEQMPLYVVERVRDLLDLRQRSLKKATVLVLGVAYKRDVNDVRESPALEVIADLLEKGCHVSYADPLVPQIKIGKKLLKSKKISQTLLKRQQVVVVLTDHSAFDYELLIHQCEFILDTRNVLRRFHPRKNLFFL